MKFVVRGKVVDSEQQVKPTIVVKQGVRVTSVPAAAPKMVLETPLAIPTHPYYSSMQSIANIHGDLSDYDEDEMPNEYVYNLVFVIGTGGTGGYVVRDLSRYLSTLPYANRVIMVLCDGDTVEDRNRIRQNFITKDIGKNKAEVLAHRYMGAYGLKILAIPHHLTTENIDEVLSKKAITKLLQMEAGITRGEKGGNGPMIEVNLAIISCVDNNKTRALISKNLGLDSRTALFNFNERVFAKADPDNDEEDDSAIQIKAGSISWIDSGNETSAGQVIVYYDSLFTSNRTNSGWQWDGRGYHFARTQPPCPAVPDGGRLIFGNFPQYLKYLDAEGYKKNFTGRAVDARTQATVKLIKAFDPFVPDAEARAKLILGSSRASANRLTDGYFTFPITWVYPDVLLQADDQTNLEMSCTERAVVDPQNLMVNVQAASHIVYYASRIFASNPKTAFLDSFGCSWSGTQCVDYKLTKTNIARILDPNNMKKVFGENYGR